MFNTNCGASVPLVANIDGNGGNNGMFGNDSWIGLIIILALLSGGFGGFGGGFGGNRVEPYATQSDVRDAVDNQTLISKIDQQTYGLSSTFTALNDTLNSNFRGIDNAICTLGYQNQQGFNTLGHQISDCCCQTQRLIERGFADTNYNIATQACDIKHAINDSTRQVLDFLTTDKIATLQAENQNLKLKASQAEQNAYLLNELKPCPSPAYVVQPPVQVSFPTNCCGQFAGFSNYGYGNNGCGCGCA